MPRLGFPPHRGEMDGIKPRTCVRSFLHEVRRARATLLSECYVSPARPVSVLVSLRPVETCSDSYAPGCQWLP